MLCRCFLGAKLAREGKSGDPYHFLSLTPILSGLVNSVDSRGNLQCHYEQAVSNSIIPQLESSSIYRDVQSQSVLQQSQSVLQNVCYSVLQ